MAERVWDRYLTEQDKASLAGRQERRIGWGEHPALVFIDLYRAVFGDKPEPLVEAIKRWPSSCGMAGWNAIPHLQRLLAAARERQIPVIHITGLDGVPGWSPPRKGARRQPDDADGRAANAARLQIIDEVAPIDGEWVLKKTSPSAFWGTPLVGLLNGLGVDTVIIGGESTSGCVRSSVTDACTNRLKVTVVEECVFDRHEASHAMHLFGMQKYADIVSLDETLETLDEWKSAHPDWPPEGLMRSSWG